MNLPLRAAAAALLAACAATDARAEDKPRDKPLPEPLAMGVTYAYQPGNNSWYAPVVGGYVFATPAYYTVYPAYRPVVVALPTGPVATVERTAPVVIGPTWALAPVTTAVSFPVGAAPYPWGAVVPVYGRYSWDYTGQYSGGYGAKLTSYPHYPYVYAYPTLTGRVWMGYAW
jgi:hypothetical protein